MSAWCRDVVLDGEFIVAGTDGAPSFQGIARRAKQTQPGRLARLVNELPATLIAFDVLSIDGEDWRAQPYRDRVQWLAELPASPALAATPRTTDGPALWRFVTERGLEGIVAKAGSSRYVAGRQSTWVKLKVVRTLSALVTGLEPGEGSRATSFGALLVSLYDGDELVQVGKVGSGFSQADLREISHAKTQFSDAGQLGVASRELRIGRTHEWPTGSLHARA